MGNTQGQDKTLLASGKKSFGKKSGEKSVNEEGNDVSFKNDTQLADYSLLSGETDKNASYQNSQDSNDPQFVNMKRTLSIAYDQEGAASSGISGAVFNFTNSMLCMYIFCCNFYIFSKKHFKNHLFLFFLFLLLLESTTEWALELLVYHMQ